jgi:hypothetical protein
VLGIDEERVAEGALGVLVAGLLFEDGPELERDRGVVREAGPGRGQHRLGPRERLGFEQQAGEGDVRVDIAAIGIERLLIQRERLFAFATPHSRLGLEPEQALAGRILAARLGDHRQRLVDPIGLQAGLHAQGVECRIGAAVAPGSIDRGDSSVELAQLQVGHAD